MNRSTDILEFLCSTDDITTVVVTPNAPPIVRRPIGVDVALSTVLDAADVQETLMAFRAQAPRGKNEGLERSGAFSFGIRKMGRFRVTHATQRSTKVFAITRIPSTIPDIAAICDDGDALEGIAAALNSPGPGVLAVYGPNATSNSLLIYSVLQKVNHEARKIIYVLERALTFLMAHDNSIVVQREIETDVDTFEEGVRNALAFAPDILFLGDVLPDDDIPSAAHAVESGILTILSSVTLDAGSLVRKLSLPSPDEGMLPTLSVNAVKVLPLTSNHLKIELFRTDVPG